MNIRFIIIYSLIFSLVSLNVFGLTNFEKLAIESNKNGIPAATPQLVDRILKACKDDKNSRREITQKEEEICNGIREGERIARKGYEEHIKACGYRKLIDLTIFIPNFFDKYFIDYLEKHHALNLVNSIKTRDILQLNKYKDACMKELTNKLLPEMIRKCKKTNSFSAFRAKSFAKTEKE